MIEYTEKEQMKEGLYTLIHIHKISYICMRPFSDLFWHCCWSSQILYNYINIRKEILQYYLKTIGRKDTF